MKFYAVKNGRVPGIYLSWALCEAQVKGFPGALFKSFSTEEEALAYLQDAPPESPLSDAPFPEIYVDGSFDAESGAYSYGMVVLRDGEELCFKEKFTDPEMAVMRNVAGEIQGARAAMDYALREGLPGIYLYHDYAGIAHWCTGTWRAKLPGTQAYQAYYQSIRDQLKVEFIKVKGHSHNRFNDLADSLAKEALGLKKPPALEEQEGEEG